MNNLASCVLLCLLGLVTLGCGGGGDTVAGKVTYGEGTPAPRGVVFLSGDDGSYSAKIGPDGTYMIENVAPGTYGVAVTGVYAQEVNNEMEYDASGNPLPAGPEPDSLVAMKYTDPSASGLEITVPGGDYDLALEAAN